jgi:hypothetical protein
MPVFFFKRKALPSLLVTIINIEIIDKTKGSFWLIFLEISVCGLMAFIPVMRQPIIVGDMTFTLQLESRRSKEGTRVSSAF